MRTGNECLVAVSYDVILDEGASYYQITPPGFIGTPNGKSVELVVNDFRGRSGFGDEFKGKTVDGTDGIEGMRLHEAFLAEDVIAVGDDW